MFTISAFWSKFGLFSSSKDAASPLMSLPPEIWGMIIEYLSDDIATLNHLLSLSKSTNTLMKRKGTVRRLSIKLLSRNKQEFRPFPKPEWFSRFPSLESFELLLDESRTCPLNILDICALPRSLQHLMLGFADSISDNMLGDLPPQLLTLSLNRNSRITDKGISKLPQSLTSLSLENNYAITTYSYEQLPRSLRTLVIKVNGPFTDIESSSLPSGLTKLTLILSHEFNDQAVAAIPRNLRSLKIDYQSFDAAKALLLPKELTELEFKCSTNPDLVVECLPRTLIRLVMHNAKTLTPEGILKLPQSLKSLTLSASHDVSSEWLASLPQQLEHLNISHSIIDDDSILIHLPKSIKVLNLSQISNLTNKSFKFLPPNIEKLSLKWEITSVSFDPTCQYYAPPSLRLLELDYVYTRPVEGHPIIRAFPNAQPKKVTSDKSRKFLIHFSTSSVSFQVTKFLHFQWSKTFGPNE